MYNTYVLFLLSAHKLMELTSGNIVCDWYRFMEMYREFRPFDLQNTIPFRRCQDCQLHLALLFIYLFEAGQKLHLMILRRNGREILGTTQLARLIYPADRRVSRGMLGISVWRSGTRSYCCHHFFTLQKVEVTAHITLFWTRR